MSQAWLSAFRPGDGWVELDPTNDRVVEDLHFPLGFGRNYDDVNPVRASVVGQFELSGGGGGASAPFRES